MEKLVLLVLAAISVGAIFLSAGLEFWLAWHGVAALSWLCVGFRGGGASKCSPAVPGLFRR